MTQQESDKTPRKDSSPINQSHENSGESEDQSLIPWYIVGITAIISAVALITIAVLGPAMLGVIQYRTSQSGIWQTQAFDITGIILLAPLLLVGGISQLLKRDSAKYFLVLTPITLMYTGLEYGLAQEWSNTTYTGNSEAYSGLFLTLVVAGLILLVGSLSRFTRNDAPNFKTKWLKVYVGIMAAFLLMFMVMWSSQLFEVMATGNTSAGDYLTAPTAWWVTKFFDLGITIPVGFLALLLLLSKPRRVYPIVLLFFGFFITLGTAVNASAIVEVANSDPTITGLGAAGLIIFPVLGALAYSGLFYLIKDKLRWFRNKPEIT